MRFSLRHNFLAGWLCLLTVILLNAPTAQAEGPGNVGEQSQGPQFDISFDLVPTVSLKAITATGKDQPFDELPRTLEELKELEELATKLVDRYQKATVNIQVGMGQGSGVVVSPEGHVLTAAHVVGEVGNRVTIVFPDGRRHRARVAGVDPGVDAAIVRMEGRGPYPYIPMAKDEFAIPGRWVMAIGHPNGYESTRLPVVRLGRVITNTQKTIQSDCSLVGGDSGGPLFDLSGRVVAIHSRIGVSNSFNFHVPVQVYLSDWEKLNAGYTRPEKNAEPIARKAYLGIRGRDSTGGGCFVTEVTPKGPAAEGGMKRNDIIINCDGEKINSFPDLVGVLKTKSADDEITMTVKRQGQTKMLTITLGETDA